MRKDIKRKGKRGDREQDELEREAKARRNDQKEKMSSFCP